MTDRQTLALVTALLRVADVVTAEIAHSPAMPFADLVTEARDLLAAVDRALAPNQARAAPAGTDLDVLVMAPERLDAMLTNAVQAYEASLTATLDRTNALTRDDRVVAMRAALAAALWGFPP